MIYDWVSFTTDYGLDDGFVAACKGVLATRVPAVRVIDVTHLVPPRDVRRGSLVLAQAVPYLPMSVHLAIVDPGVGTGRRAIVAVAGSGVLVGPDNGLLLPAADALGGVQAAYELNEPAAWLPRVSRTFHGRDIFAPVAAALADGTAPEQLGSPVATEELVRLPAPTLSAEPGRLIAEVLAVDHFGNVQLAAGQAELDAAQLPAGTRVVVRGGAAEVDAVVGTTFADVPELSTVVIVDSADRVAVAVNGGSAARALHVEPGSDVTIARAEPS